jgi:hypothetical protein
MSAGNDDGLILGRFRLIGPLPWVSLSDCPVHFEGDRREQETYAGFRAHKPRSRVQVYHLLDIKGGVAGFVACQVGVEDYTDAFAVFALVNYIFLKRRHRSKGLTRHLLAPMLTQVRSALSMSRQGDGWRPTKVFSASEDVTREGTRVLTSLEKQLLALTNDYSDVQFIGKYFEHPPGARERPWEPLAEENNGR